MWRLSVYNTDDDDVRTVHDVKGIKKAMLIFVAVGILAAGVTTALVLFVFHKGTPKPPSEAQLLAWQVPISKMTTNVEDGGVVQMSFALQAKNANDFTLLTDETAEIENDSIALLAKENPNELSTPQGIQNLRNSLLAPFRAEASTVYITAFVVEAGS